MASNENGEKDMFDIEGEGEMFGQMGDSQGLVLRLEGTQQAAEETFKPFTQANFKRDFKLGDEELEEESDEDEENKGLALEEQIHANEKQKEELNKKIKVLEKEDKEAEEVTWRRTARMEEKKSYILKQEAELFRQQETLQQEKKWEKVEEVTTDNLNKKIKEIEDIVVTTGDNVVRVSRGKAAAVESIKFKTETLHHINESKKKIFLFYPGKDMVISQPKSIKEEFELAKGMKIINTGEMKQIATEIKDCEISDKNEVIGVCFIKWKEMEEAEEENLKREELRLLSSLRLICGRGGEKFGRFILVIPQQVGKNSKDLEALALKIESTYNPDIESINMSEKLEKSWMKLAEGGEEEKGGYECYYFCRSLSEIAKMVSEKNVDVETGECEECGLLHGEQCLLKDESVSE